MIQKIAARIIITTFVLFSLMSIQANAIFFGGKIKAFFPCTCGPGYMTVVKGAPGSPSGFYYFGPNVLRWLGAGLPPEWFFSITPGINFCWMNAGDFCFAIPGFNVIIYGGSI